jgi:DNA-binding beta-propeller fold protein YncE
MAVDLRRGRLFVAELGNGTVDVVDLAAGKVIHRIAGLREPQGVGYSPQADVIAVASAGDGSVRLFKGEGFSPLGVISLGEDADNVRLDTRTGQLVVGYGSGGLAVLDPAGRSVVGTSRLPAHPEGFQLDPDTRRAFVNVPDAGQVAVVDLAAGKQIASWRLPGLKANFPMALDAAGAVLATVFRSPPRLALLDANTGAVTANIPVCGDADDVFFDAKRRRIYVSCGEGMVDVLQGDAAGYHPPAHMPTHSGARTSLFVPELDRLFVAARAGLLGSDAALLVLRPKP